MQAKCRFLLIFHTNWLVMFSASYIDILGTGIQQLIQIFYGLIFIKCGRFPCHDFYTREEENIYALVRFVTHRVFSLKLHGYLWIIVALDSIGSHHVR